MKTCVYCGNKCSTTMYAGDKIIHCCLSCWNNKFNNAHCSINLYDSMGDNTETIRGLVYGRDYYYDSKGQPRLTANGDLIAGAALLNGVVSRYGCRKCDNDDCADCDTCHSQEHKHEPEEEALKCTCGSEAVHSNVHSEWCELYEEESPKCED